MLLSALPLGCASQHDSVGRDPDRARRTFEFTYQASIEAVPAGAKQVRLWIPVPEDTPDQDIRQLEIDCSHPYVMHAIEEGRGRSLCITSPGEPIDVTMTFVVTRFEAKGGGPASAAELRAHLEPDALIPLDGKVASVAASLPTNGSAAATSKVLYDHTLERMKYDKPSDGGGWGRGDAEWACDAKYGNCTDFHSYFIGLARAKHIPARFEMGFSIPGGEEDVAAVGGYHCWAYFFDDEAQQWIPVDISEADKNSGQAEYFFGTLDENRVTFTGGRDLLLSPRPAKGRLNFLVYPYAEVDGVELAGVKKSFSRRNL
jgi:transglutaminase-like putative cysteine protease